MFELKIFPCVCVCVYSVCLRVCVSVLHNIHETLNNTKTFTIYVSTMIRCLSKHNIWHY